MDEGISATLAAFLRGSRFAASGSVMTDLDGTAVIERNGRTVVAADVELALKRLRDLGCPVAINTLRFPRNVVETFGRAWAAITDTPLPLVSLNGAVTGLLVETKGGVGTFEELDARPLPPEAIAELLAGLRGLVEAGRSRLLLFHYPRDWRAGEWIWSPDPSAAQAALRAYPSASAATSWDHAELKARLLEAETCMTFLLLDEGEEAGAMFQHLRPGSFVTARGVDKLAGARRLAERLGFDLAHSVGAGDTPMDSFLAGCGLAIQVGPLDPGHRGRLATLRVSDAAALGATLRHLAGLLPEGVGRG
jgi:hydroxymethylpyrimidine pyrophosphatase-like HAD family hydrolase